MIEDEQREAADLIIQSNPSTTIRGNGGRRIFIAEVRFLEIKMKIKGGRKKNVYKCTSKARNALNPEFRKNEKNH